MKNKSGQSFILRIIFASNCSSCLSCSKEFFSSHSLSPSLCLCLSPSGTHTHTHTHGSSLKCSGLIYPIEQSFNVDYLIRDELLSWLQLIVLLCVRISPLIHRILPNLTFLSLFPHPISVEFTRLNFFPFTLSFSALPYICSSSPIFLFPFFSPWGFLLPPLFPSISFTLQGSKWLSDGRNPTLQTQQKWWLASSRAFLAPSVCVCVCLTKRVFHLCSRGHTASGRPLPVVVLPFFSPKSFFVPQSFCLWWAILGRVHNSCASRPNAFSIDPSERNTTHREHTQRQSSRTHTCTFVHKIHNF